MSPHLQIVSQDSRMCSRLFLDLIINYALAPEKAEVLHLQGRKKGPSSPHATHEAHTCKHRQ